MGIITHNFRFLDLRNYIAPSYSLDNYIRAFLKEAPDFLNTKGFFPYLSFRDMSFVLRTDFPSFEECNKSVREHLFLIVIARNILSLPSLL